MSYHQRIHFVETSKSRVFFGFLQLFQVFSSKCAFEPRRRKRAKDAHRMAGSSLDEDNENNLQDEDNENV